MKATIGGTASKKEKKAIAKDISRKTDLDVEVSHDDDDGGSGGRSSRSSGRIDMSDKHADHWNRDH